MEILIQTSQQNLRSCKTNEQVTMQTLKSPHWLRRGYPNHGLVSYIRLRTTISKKTGEKK